MRILQNNKNNDTIKLFPVLDYPPHEQAKIVLIDSCFSIFPPTVNNIWTNARGRTILSAHGRYWYDTMQWHILAKRKMGEIPLTVIKVPCEVSLSLFPPDIKTRDVDNYSKGILDAMTRNLVWEDDSLVYRLTVEKFPRVKGGAFRIKIMV